jgi:hypothetical protein
MNVNHILGTAFVAAWSCLAGCQSWQGASFPIQNATRVPPPGTGTYQLPNRDYHNTGSSSSALPGSTSLMHAAAPPVGLRSATGSTPSAQLPATNLVAPSPVVAAAYTDPNRGQQTSQAPLNEMRNSPVAVSQPATSTPSPGGATGNLSDSNAREVPSLQWQQFDGQ